MDKPRLDQGPDYERGFIDGMMYQTQTTVNKAVDAMSKPAQEPDALTIAYQSGYYNGKKAALAQPAQEPVLAPAPGYCKNCKDYTIEEPLYAQPAQEPVARVMGTYGGRFTYEPLNRAMVLPTGMALYAGPA